MPLYEYECTACHKRTEKIQKFADVEITECPHCGGKLERVLSAPAVSFKGGGWYADLYSSTKKPAAGSSGGESKSSSDSGGSGSGGSGSASSAASSGGESKAAPAAAAPAASPAPAKGSS